MCGIRRRFVVFKTWWYTYRLIICPTQPQKNTRKPHVILLCFMLIPKMPPFFLSMLFSVGAQNTRFTSFFSNTDSLLPDGKNRSTQAGLPARPCGYPTLRVHRPIRCDCCRREHERAIHARFGDQRRRQSNGRVRRGTSFSFFRLFINILHQFITIIFFCREQVCRRLQGSQIPIYMFNSLTTGACLIPASKTGEMTFMT